jgi:predicted PurR-regulated permease PerM
MEVTLIVCVIAVGGYILYQLWPFFSSIYAFFVRCYDFLKGIIEWVVDLFLEIYQWVTKAFEDVVEYMGQILDFVEEIPEVMEEFFVSAFGDFEQVISSMNPKETVEGFGKTLQGFGNDIYSWMKCI